MDDTYAYEIAAERAALHKAVHGPVKAFFLAQGLESEFGPYPLFWKDLAAWEHFKEVYRRYSRWTDGGGSSARPAAAPAPLPASAPAAPAVASAEAPLPPLGVAADASEPAPAARKRKRWSEKPGDDSAAAATEEPPLAQQQQQKRKQRWTVDSRLTADGKPPMAAPTFRSRTRFGNRIVPAATTLLPPGATPLQEVLFVSRVQLDEIAARVMLLPAELKRVEADPARSPSPDAEYDSTGKRLNSREQRMRRALDVQRDALLERLMDLNPTMCNGGSGPKFLRKVYIPVRECEKGRVRGEGLTRPQPPPSTRPAAAPLLLLLLLLQIRMSTSWAWSSARAATRRSTSSATRTARSLCEDAALRVQMRRPRRPGRAPSRSRKRSGARTTRTSCTYRSPRSASLSSTPACHSSPTSSSLPQTTTSLRSASCSCCR